MLWRKIIGGIGALALAATVSALVLASPASAAGPTTDEVAAAGVPGYALSTVLAQADTDNDDDEMNRGRARPGDDKKDDDKKDDDKKDDDKRDERRDDDKKDDKDDDDKRDELPVTGSPAGTAAGGAAGLLALGGVLYLLARPRRATFTA